MGHPPARAHHTTCPHCGAPALIAPAATPPIAICRAGCDPLHLLEAVEDEIDSRLAEEARNDPRYGQGLPLSDYPWQST